MAVDSNEFLDWVNHVRMVYENGSEGWSPRYTLEDDDFYELVAVDPESAVVCLDHLRSLKPKTLDLVKLGEELNELVLHSELSETEKIESIMLACRLMKSWYSVCDISFRLLVLYGGRLSSKARRDLKISACREGLIHPLLCLLVCR